jgi:HD superfamily phosphodiesterase
MKVPLLSTLFHYVLLTTRKYGIDESHGLSHSMNILRYANAIFEEELKWSPNPDLLKAQEPLIYTAAVVHDMCDKKYRVEEDGLDEISRLLEPVSKLSRDDKTAVLDIVSSMSYSKVKKCGFPALDSYQTAYHIVREADLLTAYDFDRSMIYHMSAGNTSLDQAFLNAKDLFYDRVLRHNEDGLFFTRYAQRHSNMLHNRALMRMLYWKKMMGRVG